MLSPSSRHPLPAPAVHVRPFTPVDASAVLALIDRNRTRFHTQGLNQLPLTPADFDNWTRSSRTFNEHMLGVFE